MQDVYQSFHITNWEEKFAVQTLAETRNFAITSLDEQYGKIKYLFKGILTWLIFIATALIVQPIATLIRVVKNSLDNEKVVLPLINALKNEIFFIMMAVALPFYFLYCTFNKNILIEADPKVLFRHEDEAKLVIKLDEIPFVGRYAVLTLLSKGLLEKVESNARELQMELD